jgi:hypothetical protein
MPRGLLRMMTTAIFALGIGLAPADGNASPDEPGFLGRIFRFGSSSPSAPRNPSRQPGRSSLPAPGESNSGAEFPTGAVPPSQFDGITDGPSTAPLPDSPAGALPRLIPRPRTSQAITTAEPILVRTALGRSTDGTTFGMFFQVFADGTVIDSEGVHRLRPAELKPLLDLIQSGELMRLRGHCGAPSTDYVDHVQIIVFERRLGRLQAASFSYSGNPQGCDHAIRHLHAALENLQARLSIPATTAGSATSPAAAPPTPTLPTQPPQRETPTSAPAGAATIHGGFPATPDPSLGNLHAPAIPLSPLGP